ncbi:MAG: TM0106 family RecB-like putative nuclease [Herbiconiux sp.]|nr:TM0106 family RecB-like putative nuclease [Herbiconiux sp.]
MIVVDGMAPGGGALGAAEEPGRTLLYSATDLSAAAQCEFALVRRLDAKLGRIPPLVEVADAMLERTARLGDAHELRTLEALRAQYGAFDGVTPGGVAEIERPERAFGVALTEGLLEGQRRTVEALEAGADVVFQGTFFDGRFLGYSDFLIRLPESRRYEVYDTKLARHAKITALLQLAAYTDQLQRLGIPVGEETHLLLGDGSRSTHRVRDLLPVFLDRRARLERLLDERVAPATPAVAWGDERYTVCGRCDVCAPEVAAHGDLLLVAGMRHTQRAKLIDSGITSLDELAALDREQPAVVPGMAAATLEGLRDQARMQVEGRDGLAFRVFDASALAGLPQPDPGDLFFDFEGDPLYTEQAGPDWGLDYLFGVIEHDLPGDAAEPGATLSGLAPGTLFRPYWAHSHAEEAVALQRFLDHATRRLAEHPGLHIYHYANYERAHLQSLCARHGVGEQQLDELLRRNVLVDLYPVVKRSIRVSAPSYSLKKLEPLYMGELYRASEVTNAADSITAYVHYTELRDAGATDARAAEQARVQLAEIADYNEYDCVSTLRLRDWLLGLAATHGAAPEADGPDEPAELDGTSAPDLEPSPVHRALLGHLEAKPPLPPLPADDHRAVALAAAAIDYHAREDKSFWWEHYNRLDQPLDEWADTRDVLVVTAVRVERDWHRNPGQRADRRHLLLRGVLAPGSRLEAGAAGRFLVYEPPHPWPAPRSRRTDRVAHDRTTLLEVRELANGVTQYLFEERLPVNGEPYAAVPVAVAPSAPPKTASLQGAIAEWGARLADELPGFPADPAVDILRRAAPRRRDGQPLEAVASGPRGTVDAIRDSLLALDDSYLAVQGPPGTGKTYTGARVVAELVRDHGWSVGVVAQSHAVVDHMLDAIVRAGVPAEAVAKATDDETVSFTRIRKEQLGRVLADAERAGTGVVVGGTAWDFTNPTRVDRRRLDLLVIDEAGQYSLANTVAVSVAAHRLLLLGDPQQLPQVTQGTHPEPVDTSALGWLTDGHDVLPPELGYFLDVSWRMHPAVCAPVSELSYEGALHAKLPVTTDRRLEGIPPGLRLEPIRHHGNATESPEEAERVLAIVRDVLGRAWSDPSEGTAPGADVVVSRPIDVGDIIVVAPYNAQVELLRSTLAAAGFAGVAVGTVDKFQGREAPVAIVSLAASSAVDVPRGIGFLLMKNRLNVAVSRAKWVAHLVYSPALTDHLPVSVDELGTMSSFLRLTQGAAGPR